MAGRPARSASNRRVWFSAETAPAASSHEVPCRDEQDTTMSNSSDALVGAAGMKARKRGLSQEITAGARCSAEQVEDVGGVLGSGARARPPGPCPGRPSRRGGPGQRDRGPAATGSSRRSATPDGHRERTSGCAPTQLAAPEVSHSRGASRSPSTGRQSGVAGSRPRPARYSLAARRSSTQRGSK